jgi:hypothetical protein
MHVHSYILLTLFRLMYDAYMTRLCVFGAHMSVRVAATGHRNICTCDAVPFARLDAGVSNTCV